MSSLFLLTTIPDPKGRRVFEVSIDSVRPISLAIRGTVFRDGQDGEGTARERVQSILRGFVACSLLPPVDVVCDASESEFRFKLTHGVHRLYCSLAAGFTHVPAVEGYEYGT